MSTTLNVHRVITKKVFKRTKKEGYRDKDARKYMGKKKHTNGAF